MGHPPGDGWWSFARLPGRYDKVSAAVLNLSGWFDEMYGPSGAVENFEGAGDALIIGPWTHGVAETQQRKAGDRDFGPAAALNYNGTVLAWMDRYLKGVDSATHYPSVRVFVMGSNRWRSADRWPFPGTRPDTLYLERRAGRKTGDLVKRSPAAAGGETVIHSDPAHPVNDPFKGNFGAHDYRSLKASPSVAVFETAPFAKPVEIIGQVVIELTASAPVPDYDLWAQLYDVAPDGTAWNLSTPGTALQRASYREGGPDRKLLKPGETARLRMDKLVTANRFLKGHRLRVVIMPAFAPLFSINSQTGAQEFESDSVRMGEIRIGHAAGRVSLIVLPVVP
jgi:hypothetical protein